MTITHLIQLQHFPADAVPRPEPREVALGYSLAVIKLRNGITQLAGSTFGLDSGRLRNAFDGAIEATSLGPVAQAIWDNQRCLVPITGFRSTGANIGSSRWISADGGIAYVPALRFSIEDHQGRHGECQVLVRPSGLDQLMPLALDQTTPLQWMRLSGTDALQGLTQPWRRH